MTIDDKEEKQIYFSIQNLNSEEMRIVKVYLEHPIDNSTKTFVGFQSEIIPRQNLGKILIDTQNSQSVILSADNILIISPKSFSSFKFEYEYIQGPGSYVTGVSEDPDEIPGATVISNTTTKWDKFFLVIRYLTENGVEEIKSFIN